MNVVEVKGLTFGYEDGLLFEDVSFDVNSGDFAAIVGDNGVGKSTMIKLLLGLIKPNKGTVKILDKDVTSMKDFTSVGYVPQNSGALASNFPASVEEIIRYSICNKKLSKSEREALINEALETVSLTSSRHKLIRELSGGQQQRVMLARVLINKPSILILDEPTVGIDGESVDRLLEILHTLNIDRKVTILMVTHDLKSVSSYINKVLCISDHSLAEESASTSATIVHAHSHKHSNTHPDHIHCAACDPTDCKDEHCHNHCHNHEHNHEHHNHGHHEHDHEHGHGKDNTCEGGASNE